jgi:peroxiredoxin
MISTQTPICDFNTPAIDFNLKGVDGKIHNLASCKGKNGLLVMFICNHCPYVKAIIERIIKDTKELKALGLNAVAIMSNNPKEYEADSFENMQKIAKEMDFSFPYLMDIEGICSVGPCPVVATWLIASNKSRLTLLKAVSLREASSRPRYCSAKFVL